ncbi:MAG: hypothetical protein GWO24_19635 [Akkermansiaceae bacterium]|nr:hypothetical protein [Akkermansiaceae bacterium]
MKDLRRAETRGIVIGRARGGPAELIENLEHPDRDCGQEAGGWRKPGLDARLQKGSGVGLSRTYNEVVAVSASQVLVEALK